MQLETLLQPPNKNKKPPHKFCVYYDEWTGELTQITNKPKQGAGSYILSSDDIAKKLMLGELSFTKYSVVDTSEGPKLLPKDNVIRLKKAENVLSLIDTVSFDIENDINIVFYVNDWKMEINFSQDTMFRMTGVRDHRKALLSSKNSGQFDFYLIKDNDPTFFIKHFNVDIVDLLSQGYLLYDLHDLRTICGLGDINILTKRVLKSYGIKYKKNYTGSDYHRRKTQRRVFRPIEVDSEFTTFSICPNNKGGSVIKSNFNDPKEYKIYKDITMYITDNDPTYYISKITLPFDKIGWGQEYFIDFELNQKQCLLLGEQYRNVTFKYEEEL